MSEVKRPPEKPRFRVGEKYDRPTIHERLGGGLQDFLPHVEGRVVCACLRSDTNPDAPTVILPGTGSGIESSAWMLLGQASPIPVFMKRCENEWEYIGEYEFESFSRNRDAIAEQKKRSARSDIT